MLLQIIFSRTSQQLKVLFLWFIKSNILSMYKIGFTFLYLCSGILFLHCYNSAFYLLNEIFIFVSLSFIMFYIINTVIIYIISLSIKFSQLLLEKYFYWIFLFRDLFFVNFRIIVISLHKNFMLISSKKAYIIWSFNLYANKEKELTCEKLFNLSTLSNLLCVELCLYNYPVASECILHILF